MSRFIIPGLIIGSKVSIAKFGAVIGNDEPSKTCLLYTSDAADE